MTEFVLNHKKISTTVPKGMLLVDFIRENAKIKGTKTACREGDCGSCTVIEGTLVGKTIKYKAIASCITPMGNVHGKHIVTIEGLDNKALSPIQHALIDAAAIQCGYCTPGIVLSLTSYILSSKEFSYETAKAAVGGNICRCTGYKSIERALENIINQLKEVEIEESLSSLIKNGYIPQYFNEIPDFLRQINFTNHKQGETQIVGGGTDLFVQNPDLLFDTLLQFVSDIGNLNRIVKKGNRYSIGAACKISDLECLGSFNDKIPEFQKYISLIGSKLIRNMATVAGNIVNASPIGDLSIIFLGLNANLIINSDKKNLRQIPLKEFFKSYKDIDLYGNEYIESIDFEIPDNGFLFNFEKVCKREYLDIASVNSAVSIHFENETIKQIHISMGGVSSIPLYLRKTCKYLTGKLLSEKTILEAAKIMATEISPIDDVRGSTAYKRLLARQLFYAHLLEIFPGRFSLDRLLKTNH